MSLVKLAALPLKMIGKTVASPQLQSKMIGGLNKTLMSSNPVGLLNKMENPALRNFAGKLSQNTQNSFMGQARNMGRGLAEEGALQAKPWMNAGYRPNFK